MTIENGHREEPFLMNGNAKANHEQPPELSLNGGSAHSTQSRRSLNGKRGLGRGGIPRRSKSTDGAISRVPRRSNSSEGGVIGKMKAGLRGGKRNTNELQQQQQPFVMEQPFVMDATVQPAATPPPPPPAQMASSLPNSTTNSPLNNGKGLRRSRAVAPGAVYETAPPTTETASLVELSLQSGDSAHGGKMRNRARATTPGAVSESSTAASSRMMEPSLGASLHGTASLSQQQQPSVKSEGPAAPQRSLSGDSAHSGKLRGRARATTPGAVSESGSIEPSLGASLHGAAALTQQPNRGSSPLRRTLSGDSTNSKKMRGLSKNGASAEPSLGASVHRSADSTGADGNASPPGVQDSEAIRRKQIQEIMMDPTLTQREKQLKTQQLLMSGMSKPQNSGVETEKAASVMTDGPETESYDPQAIRRKEIQLIMSDSSLSQADKQTKIQQLMASGMPKQVANSSEVTNENAVNNSRASTRPPRSSANVTSEIPAQRRGLRRTRTDDSASPSVSPARGLHPNANSDGTSKSTGPPGPGADLGNYLDPHSISGSTGHSFSLGLDESNHSLGDASFHDDHGAEHLSRLSTKDESTPSAQPGTVSMLSGHSGGDQASSSGTSVGGAPQGKIRRTGTTPVTQPGAVGVPGPSNAEPGGGLIDASSHHSRAIGGAPQGKQRRTTLSSPSRPGAVSVEGPSSAAPSEPGASTPTRVGGAPQGKMRRATAGGETSAPGAVSVPGNVSSEPQEPGSSTGVGGAPQGKIRRTTVTPIATPGAVSVAPSSSECLVEPGASTGVGGAPQGKIRRTTASNLVPGAVSVVEPVSRSEPGSTTVVGGAPQGKFRRTTAASVPGAVNIVEPSAAPSEPGASTGVGGAPQGKFRRPSTVPASAPGAVSVVEPSEPGAATGVGGAPQGKFRRTTVTPVAPGAVSMPEPSSTIDRSSHHTAGYGRASQSAQEPSMLSLGASKEPPSIVPPVPVRSMQTSNHTQGTPSSIVSSIESDMLAKSNVRRSRPATVRPGAQSVSSAASTTSTIGDLQSIDSDAVISSIERDMIAKTSARGSRSTSAASVLAGAQSVVTPRIAEPDQDVADAISSAERDMLSKARARTTISLPSSSLHSAGPASRGLGSSNMRGLPHSSGHSAVSHGTSVYSELTDYNTTPNYQPLNPAEEGDDFEEAIKLVEEDLQLKMNLRDAAGDRPVLPGAVAAGASEDEAALRRKSQGPTIIGLDEPNAPFTDEKESFRIGAQSGPNGHRTVQERMEQKILQMEQEQQARDVKLDEIEEMNARRVGPERHKIAPSPRVPQPEVFDDEGGPVDNGFMGPTEEAIRQAEEDGLAIAVAVDEDDEPDVYDVELKMYDPEAKPPFYKNRRFRCYSALILIVTLAAVITAAVLSAQQAKEIIFITQAPSAAPSQAPTTTRETAVRGELERVIGDIVNEPGTVYDAALDWILFDDPMQLDEFSENLIQRYTLALFYFQTSQDNPWLSCNPPVGDEDYSCEFYEMNRLPDNSIQYAPRDELGVRWLSEKHECEWAEVMCHPETDGNVIAIDILGQNLTGTLPNELKHLDRLMWLTLSFNWFTGTIPEVYGEFPYLTIFECTANLISGQIPPGFFRQPNLLQLNPAYNAITGTLPTEIGDLTTLHSLFFFGALLEGTLPTEIGRLEDARNLWLYDNNDLTGPIPSEIGELSLLETIKLSNNGHTGPLPSEMGRLTNLKEFLFAGTNMGGTNIPEEFWNMTSLIFLDLNGDGFGGTISTNIGRMSQLQGFKGSRNQFVGTIPTEIGELENLQLLHLHYNEGLEGEMPIEVCMLSGPDNLQFLNADCAGSIPRISCQCCTGCCDEFGQCQTQ